MIDNYISPTVGSKYINTIVFLFLGVFKSDKYIMLFCPRKYLWDSFYAPRGLAYTPLPIRPFSRHFTEKSGAKTLSRRYNRMSRQGIF